MGSYSFFNYEDIEVEDFEGAKKYIIAFCEALGGEKDKDGNWLDDTWAKNFMDMIVEDKKYITFEGWSDIKLISYWYDTQVIFLEGIAKFISGSVEWSFESSSEAGRVEFEDGKANIQTGRMTWTDNTPDDLIDEKVGMGITKEENKELNKLRCITKLK